MDRGNSFLQNVDYSYNIRGWLKAINDANLSDPDDLFGMELKYTDGFDASQNQYNGNITGVRWKNALDSIQRIDGYVYDNLNRIRMSDYQAQNGTENQHYDVELKGYDMNGNISGIKRNGLQEDSLDLYGPNDNLTYYYSGNQLKAVDDSISTTYNSGFNDNGSISGGNSEYFYDGNGNMIKDDNKGISSIKYNYLNLPDTVMFNSAKYIAYIYDAEGVKLEQNVFDGDSTPIRKTDYIGDFIYENDTLRQILTEEGRIIDPYDEGIGDNYEYQYFLKDHLGNTRITCRRPDTVVYKATIEMAVAALEEAEFTKIPQTRKQDALYNHTTPNGNESSMLNGTIDSLRIGPSIVLPVGKNDRVDIQVYAKYNGGTGNNASIIPLAALINSVGSAFGGIEGAGGESGIIYNSIEGALGLFSPSSNADDNVPRAFLNYLLFDESMRFLNAGFVAISEAAGSDFELLNLNNIYVDKNGFIYIYVSNESNVNVNVYFDDMKVTHFKSEIVQADDYYPFGLGATVKKMSCGHFQGAARERSGQGCRHRLHPNRGQGEQV